MGEKNKKIKEIDDFEKSLITTYWPQASDTWMNTAFQLAKGYIKWLENQRGHSLDTPVHHPDLPVIFTCAGLALELAFKILLATEGKIIFTHTIEKIYKKFTPETQKQVIDCMVGGNRQHLSSHRAEMLGKETKERYFRILKDKYDVRDFKYYNVGSETKKGWFAISNNSRLLAKGMTLPYSLYEVDRLRKCLLSLAKEKKPPLPM